MLITAEGRIALTEEDLCAGHWPGVKDPPWRIQGALLGELNEIAESRGIDPIEAALDGEIIDDGESVPVVIRAEDTRLVPRGIFIRYYAEPAL